MTIADKYFQIYHSISRGVSYKPMLKKIGTRKMLVLPDQHTLTHGEAKSNTNTHSRANTRANRHGKIVQKHYHLPYKLMVSSCAIFLPFFFPDISKSHDLFSLQDQLRRYRMATRVFFSTFEMPRNVNLETNLKFSLRIPRRTKDYRQDNQKINRNILVELKCICLSMLPRRSILGV